MISPRRRTTRNAYLDASVVPVEAALTERAEALKQMADSDAILAVDPAEAAIAARLSTEFRALAEELHWH